jgi:hypothetical protein
MLRGIFARGFKKTSRLVSKLLLGHALVCEAPLRPCGVRKKIARQARGTCEAELRRTTASPSKELGDEARKKIKKTL